MYKNTSYIAILFSMFEILLKHNWFKNINWDVKNKSSQNAYFRNLTIY